MIRKLQMIIDKINDRYSCLAMGRWMLKVRYNRAISRMEKYDPEGPTDGVLGDGHASKFTSAVASKD